MDTYYPVISLVHYFGESLMISLLPFSYLLNNLIYKITCRSTYLSIQGKTSIPKGAECRATAITVWYFI